MSAVLGKRLKLQFRFQAKTSAENAPRFSSCESESRSVEKRLIHRGYPSETKHGSRDLHLASIGLLEQAHGGLMIMIRELFLCRRCYEVSLAPQDTAKPMRGSVMAQLREPL